MKVLLIGVGAILAGFAMFGESAPAKKPIVLQQQLGVAVGAGGYAPIHATVVITPTGGGR